MHTNIKDILSTNIKELGFDTRVVNILYRNTFESKDTFLDLINIAHDTLIHFRNIGQKTINDIEDKISELINQHRTTFASFADYDLKMLGLSEHAIARIRHVVSYEQEPVVQEQSIIEIKIKHRKQEIAEYYATIEKMKKLIAEKEFEITKLQKTKEQAEKTK
ncbi:MAG: DNA-directed RNA polymerase subunit alpha C-terminal domain-containing protein [Alphaproteobacteria bacterium]|nr:DNA-directed RNA polymerase subunit alpha C-terminal domain-containing protein [Alphaproteobacteria bacterium]